MWFCISPPTPRPPAHPSPSPMDSRAAPSKAGVRSAARHRITSPRTGFHPAWSPRDPRGTTATSCRGGIQPRVPVLPPPQPRQEQPPTSATAATAGAATNFRRLSHGRNSHQHQPPQPRSPFPTPPHLATNTLAAATAEQTSAAAATAALSNATAPRDQHPCCRRQPADWVVFHAPPSVVDWI